MREPCRTDISTTEILKVSASGLRIVPLSLHLPSDVARLGSQGMERAKSPLCSLRELPQRRLGGPVDVTGRALEFVRELLHGRDVLEKEIEAPHPSRA